MINDPSIKRSMREDTRDRALVVDERTGLTGDHIADINARAYAYAIRQDSLEDAKATTVGTYTLARSIVRIR